MLRLIASIVRYPPIASIVGFFCLMVILLFGGSIIPRASLPGWLRWGFWATPTSYAQIAISLNEFQAPRWQKVSSSNTTIGDQVLNQYDINYNHNFYWISIGALVGFWDEICAALGKAQAVISHKKFLRLEGRDILDNDSQTTVLESEIRGMILPFEPLAISFENVQYYVDAPQNLRIFIFLHVTHKIGGSNSNPACGSNIYPIGEVQDITCYAYHLPPYHLCY
ncbi:hypothetical protein ACFE04_017120 [Oxalis oulophora]